MFCPECGHDSSYVLCPNCTATIDVQGTERLGQLAYLRRRLEGWAREGVLPRAPVEVALAQTQEELADLHARLGVRPLTIAPVPAEEAPPGVDGVTLAPAPAEGKNRVVPERTDAERPAEQGTDAPRGEAEAGAARMREAAPEAVPTRGASLTWRRVVLALMSERALSTFLVVGALLILAAASVISTLNPTHLAPTTHLGALVATTVAFFGASYALRTRFRLVRTAVALQGISAIFLPLDVWTLGQPKLLHWAADERWLVASAVCLLGYVGLHVWLRDRMFALLTGAAGASTVLALAQRDRLAPDWSACLLIALAVGYAVLAPRLRAVLPVLAWALAACGHALALGMVTLLTLSSAAILVGLTLSTSAQETLPVAWWLATLFYLIYSRGAPAAEEARRRYYVNVAAAVAAIAFLTTLQRFPVLGPWTEVPIAVAACAYMVVGYARYRVGETVSLPRLLLLWPYQVGVALSAVALLWPTATPASEAATTVLLIGLYAWGAWRLGRTSFAAIAVVLLPVLMVDAGTALAWSDLLVPWAVFTACAAVAAEVTARSGRVGEWQVGPTTRLPRWRSPFALPLVVLALTVGAAVLGAGALRYTVVFAETGLAARTAPPFVAMLLLAAVAVGAGLARRRPLFYHLAVWTFVAPYLSASLLLGERLRWSSAYAAQAWALTLLGLVYLGLAAWLDRAGRTEGRVLYPAGYVLVATAPLTVLGDQLTLLWVFGLGLAVCAWSGWLVATGRHHTYLSWTAFLMGGARGHGRALFGYLGAVLAPLWLLVALGVWFPHPTAAAYGLTLTVLTPLYLAGSVLLGRAAPEQGLPWSRVGTLLVVLGPLLTWDAPTPRLAAAAVALAVSCGAAWTLRRTRWAWGIALFLPLLAFALFDRVGMEPRWYPLGFLPVAALLLLASRALRAAGPGAGLSPWARPFFWVAYCGVTLLGLVMAGGMTVLDEVGVRTLIPTALAYGAGLACFAWWTRQRPAPWLAVVYGLLTLEGGLTTLNLAPEVGPVCWAVAALCLGVLFAMARARDVVLWAAPLEGMGDLVALAALIGAVVAVNGRPGEQALTITLAVVGLHVITQGLAYRDRSLLSRLLLYAGVALVVGAYGGQLVLRHVGQPQFFALPAGVYLLGVTYAEWRAAPRHGVKDALELLGLLIPVGTSLLQAVGIMADHTPAGVYDLIIIAEGIALIGLGALLHWTKTLLVGAAALCIDAALIVGEPLRAINTWYVVAIVGLTIIGVVVVIEQQREHIVGAVEEWRHVLETWN